MDNLSGPAIGLDATEYIEDAGKIFDRIISRMHYLPDVDTVRLMKMAFLYGFRAGLNKANILRFHG